MRSLCTLFLLLPLALPAQTIVSALGDGGWDAYPAYINAQSYAFDFHDMAGTSDGALTISTSGVADIASKGISGTPLSSFAGATYRWQSSTWSVSLKLELNRTITFGQYAYTYTVGTLVYNPGVTSGDWLTTTIDENSLWRLTSVSSGAKYRTMSQWLTYFGTTPTTIGAIELGLGTSSPTGSYAGSIDWLQWSNSSGGSATATTVDFASPIPEPATSAALLAIGGLGVALVARRRKQRQ